MKPKTIVDRLRDAIRNIQGPAARTSAMRLKIRQLAVKAVIPTLSVTLVGRFAEQFELAAPGRSVRKDGCSGYLIDDLGEVKPDGFQHPNCSPSQPVLST